MPQRPPFFLPRWFLTTKYTLLALLGLVVVYASSPSLNLTIGDPLSITWGFMLFAAASAAAIGSRLKNSETLERWSISAVVILLVVYAFSPILIILTEGDGDRLAYSITALSLAGVPTLRAHDLLSRTGLSRKAKAKS